MGILDVLGGILYVLLGMLGVPRGMLCVLRDMLICYICVLGIIFLKGAGELAL